MNLFSSSQGKLSLAQAPFLKNWQFTTLTKSFLVATSILQNGILVGQLRQCVMVGASLLFMYKQNLNPASAPSKKPTINIANSLLKNVFSKFKNISIGKLYHNAILAKVKK